MKRRLLSLARRAHISPPVYPPRLGPTPPPQQVLAEVQETNEHVDDPFPTPEPMPEHQPRPEPVRIVRHYPRWFDDDPERPRFSDMKF